MKRRLEAAASTLRGQDFVRVVSHIDADGLASAAVATVALGRAGVKNDVRFLKQLDDEAIRDLEEVPTLLTDLGSAAIGAIGEWLDTAVVVDHHEPRDAEAENVVHVNPHLFGVDGSSELSGSTATYLLAREIGENRDLSGVAVVGAVGDVQDRDGLRGLNRLVLREGEAEGVLEARKDISFFGKQTRPVHKMLEYGGDPYVPGVTGSERGALDLLDSAGVELREEGGWRRWIDLSRDERSSVVSALLRRLMRGNRADSAERLVRETYVLREEEEGTELRDVSEFSTLLNATARYGHPGTGIAVCRGDRGEALDDARDLLRRHRRNLVEGLELIESGGVTRLDNLQYFHAGDEILDTVVGIVAGMSVNLDAVDRSAPIVAFAASGEGEVKVSSRGTGSLVRRGLNLAESMRLAAEAVGGAGGGHDVAAGATIPEGREDDFLAEVDRITGEQLG
ncbi:MAG: hypothetical protein MAG715_00365 [Methanonatronarchaeales archaeon]|nr:hypothetical protein [Methanonatronarchaeales archaeon]